MVWKQEKNSSDSGISVTYQAVRTTKQLFSCLRGVLCVEGLGTFYLSRMFSVCIETSKVLRSEELRNRTNVLILCFFEKMLSGVSHPPCAQLEHLLPHKTQIIYRSISFSSLPVPLKFLLEDQLWNTHWVSVGGRCEMPFNFFKGEILGNLSNICPLFLLVLMLTPKAKGFCVSTFEIWTQFISIFLTDCSMFWSLLCTSHLCPGSFSHKYKSRIMIDHSFTGNHWSKTSYSQDKSESISSHGVRKLSIN